MLLSNVNFKESVMHMEVCRFQFKRYETWWQMNTALFSSKNEKCRLNMPIKYLHFLQPSFSLCFQYHMHLTNIDKALKKFHEDLWYKCRNRKSSDVRITFQMVLNSWKFRQIDESARWAKVQRLEKKLFLRSSCVGLLLLGG